jgi:hypothetical protein
MLKRYMPLERECICNVDADPLRACAMLLPWLQPVAGQDDKRISPKWKGRGGENLESSVAWKQDVDEDILP